MAQAQSIFIPFSGANSSLAAASLVFRPGAPGPLPSNVFTDWNLLYAAYLTTSGPVIIEIDNTFAPTTVPAGAYNFRPDTQLQGTLFGSGGTFRKLDLDDGVTFSGALWVKGILQIVSNSASPIVTVNPGDPVFQLILQEAASLRADGTAPFILNRNAFPGVLLILTEGAAFETGTSAVLEMSDESPASTFTLFNLEDSVVEDDTIDGAGIAFVTLGIASPAARFSLVQPGFSSTLGPLGQIAPSNQLINQIWNMRGFGGGAAVAVPNDCFRVTAGGGTITLPPSTEVFSGSRVRVKNRAGAGASTTIAPSGADMIDGVAAPFVTPGDADEFFEFVLDAPTGDWMVF